MQSTLYERALNAWQGFIVKNLETERYFSTPVMCDALPHVDRRNFSPTQKALIGNSGIGRTNWMLQHLSIAIYDLVVVFSASRLDYASYQSMAPNVLIIPFHRVDRTFLRSIEDFFILNDDVHAHIAFVHEHGDFYMKEFKPQFCGQISSFYFAHDLKQLPKSVLYRLQEIVFFRAAKVSLLRDLTTLTDAQSDRIQRTLDCLPPYNRVLCFKVANIESDDCFTVNTYMAQCPESVASMTIIPHMQRYREKSKVTDAQLSKTSNTPPSVNLGAQSSTIAFNPDLMDDVIHMVCQNDPITTKHDNGGKKDGVSEETDQDWMAALTSFCKAVNYTSPRYRCQEVMLQDKSIWQAILVLHGKGSWFLHENDDNDDDGGENVSCFAAVGVSRHDALRKVAKKALKNFVEKM